MLAFVMIPLMEGASPSLEQGATKSPGTYRRLTKASLYRIRESRRNKGRKEEDCVTFYNVGSSTQALINKVRCVFTDEGSLF